jgi:hypothetical protein
MKTNKLLIYGLALSLATTPIVYSQEKKFKDYIDGDPVVMIHSNKADTTLVEGEINLKTYMKNIGGTETVVKGPIYITKTDTSYVKEKLPQLMQNPNPAKSLEAKASTEQKWYNSNLLKYVGIPAACIALGILGSQLNKGKKHSHNEYNLPEPSADGGVGGGRTDEGSDAGGVRGGNNNNNNSEAGGNR